MSDPWIVLLLLCPALACAGGSRTTTGAAKPTVCPPAVDRAAPPPAAAVDLKPAIAAARADLVGRYAKDAARIDRGLEQVARYWRPDDGTAEEFGEFVRAQFVPEGPELDALFARLEKAVERTYGYVNSLQRDLKWGVDIEEGPQLPVDETLASVDLFAHLPEDFFATKVAFVAFLNFPQTRLEDRLTLGQSWSRRQWAEARLGEGRMPDGFIDRIPAAVRQRIFASELRAETYINSYNFYMHHVLAADGKRLFPPGLRLLSHWNLRDEIKAQYGGGADGLAKQRLIVDVMLRVVRQEVPAAVINNPLLDWTPSSGAVAVSAEKDAEAPKGAAAKADPAREPDTRYALWLDEFHAQKEADPFDPLYPTYLDRRFPRDREMKLEEARGLLTSVLEAPTGAKVAKVIASRLGRPLEPQDIWYDGFKPPVRQDSARLDAMTKRRFPNAAAFMKQLPDILVSLGFSRDRALYLASHIEVDPARGSGHALGPMRHDDNAHLRTRIGPDGMDYKGFNIAIHELGHNVEQVFSTVAIDHPLLQGVPNNACTEAMAMVFQARDLQVLGVTQRSADDWTMQVLDDFWQSREIAGVALVDIAVWQWLYAHPDATPARLREEVVAAATDVWNRYYADLLGRRDIPLLAIYSHLIAYPLYLTDYPMGHIVAFQVEEYLHQKGVPIGHELERIENQGRLTPDAWMRQGVGAPLSTEPLLRATEEALGKVPAR